MLKGNNIKWNVKREQAETAEEEKKREQKRTNVTLAISMRVVATCMHMDPKSHCQQCQSASKFYIRSHISHICSVNVSRNRSSHMLHLTKWRTINNYYTIARSDTNTTPLCRLSERGGSRVSQVSILTTPRHTQQQQNNRNEKTNIKKYKKKKEKEENI